MKAAPSFQFIIEDTSFGLVGIEGVEKGHDCYFSSGFLLIGIHIKKMTLKRNEGSRGDFNSGRTYCPAFYND